LEKIAYTWSRGNWLGRNYFAKADCERMDHLPILSAARSGFGGHPRFKESEKMETEYKKKAGPIAEYILPCHRDIGQPKGSTPISIKRPWGVNARPGQN